MTKVIKEETSELKGLCHGPMGHLITTNVLYIPIKETSRLGQSKCKVWGIDLAVVNETWSPQGGHSKAFQPWYRKQGHPEFSN